jgi:COP9 signalosome complex subunit 4
VWRALCGKGGYGAHLEGASFLLVVTFVYTDRPSPAPSPPTRLSLAVTEHNLEAASKLYANIYVSELGTLLGVEAAKAEQAASRMVQESRLAAAIDQVDGLITFKTAAEPLVQWDRNIAGLCGAVNAVVEQMAAAGIAVQI